MYHSHVPARLTTLAAAFLIAVSPGLSTARAAEVTSVAATQSLGDLSSYRAIAADVLKIVKTGALPVARTRIKDLETAWDRAEPTMKPRDAANWTKLDTAIDAALGDLRTPNPDAAVCAASLQTLIGMFDAMSKPA